MSAATYQPPTLTLRLDQSHWASHKTAQNLTGPSQNCHRTILTTPVCMTGSSSSTRSRNA